MSGTTQPQIKLKPKAESEAEAGSLPSKPSLESTDIDKASLNSDITEDKVSEILPEEQKKKIGRPVKWTEEALVELGSELLLWMEKEENIFFEKFLLQKGLYRELVYQYQDKFPSFLSLVKRAKEMQELKLSEGGLTRKHDNATSIFLLKAKHGLIDKPELQAGNIAPITVNFNLPSSPVSNIASITFQQPLQLPEPEAGEPGDNIEPEE